jgi:hypothetical protein
MTYIIRRCRVSADKVARQILCFAYAGDLQRVGTQVRGAAHENGKMKLMSEHVCVEGGPSLRCIEEDPRA